VEYNFTQEEFFVYESGEGMKNSELLLDEEVLKKFYYEPHNLGNHRIYRRVLIMEKGGLLGRIADYKLLDFLVPGMTLEELLPLVKPISDVMMQRFLLPGEGKMIKKSFGWGLKGWAYIGFLEGEEKVLDDLREEFRRALKPYSEGFG